MRSAVYPPPQAEGGKCLALHWLSGLARTEPNFIPKSPGSQAAASEHSLAVGDLGTNPHGSNVRGDDSWDLYTGAGFYSNATEDPWKTNCRMFSYVTGAATTRRCQLPGGLAEEVYFGHSMQGHKKSWKIHICVSICSSWPPRVVSLRQKHAM